MALSNAERQAAWRARLDAEIERYGDLFAVAIELLTAWDDHNPDGCFNSYDAMVPYIEPLRAAIAALEEPNVA